MKAALVFLAVLPALAAIDGTVTNRTTGKPQAGATVTLYKLGQAGMESIESVKSDASGKFVIARDVAGPHLIQTAYDGVTYNHMLPPGRPTNGLDLAVYNSSKQPGAAKVVQHFVLFEPDGKEMAITESFVFNNDGTTTYNDPEGGTLRFYVPPAGSKNLQINATAPQGMPIRRAPEKTGEPDVYKVDFPIKPGESNIQLNYTLPFTSPGTFQGRIFHRGGPANLIAPVGVTLKGEGLEARGQEPRTKASIFQITAPAYKIDIEGTGMLRRQPDGDSESSSGPTIETIKPKLYAKLYWVIGLAMSILALGFLLLYRAQAAPAKGKK